MSEHTDENGVAWDEFNRNTHESFWDVAIWPRGGNGWSAGVLDVADRKRIFTAAFASLGRYVRVIPDTENGYVPDDDPAMMPCCDRYPTQPHEPDCDRLTLATSHDERPS